MRLPARKSLALLLIAILLLPWATALAQQEGAAQQDPPTERALLIGIDDFVSKPSIFPSSTNNVYAMQETFQGALRPLEVLLIPEEPVVSAEALTQLIQEVFAGAQPQDTSYLYISTHGVYDPRTGREPVLLLSDGEQEGRITPAQLEAAFDGILGTKVLLLDACNSGAFIGKGMATQPETLYFLGDDFKVLTSSGALEESWYWNATQWDTDSWVLNPSHQRLLGQRPQGFFYFTQALSQALSWRYGQPADLNEDSQVTLTELYEYLLLNHAASTPQVYPQQDDFVVFRYDAQETPTGSRAPILDVSFSGTLLDATNQTLSLEFTATRPVRVAYQIVYQRDGKWLFDQAKLLYDDVERFTAFGDQTGAVSAGRKARTLSIDLEAVDRYGYVMVQLVSIEGEQLTVHAGRVLCAPPAEGYLNLAVDVASAYDLSQSRELSIFVEHNYPCALSVVIVNQAGDVVRRLCHLRGTRPAQTDPAGSLFYWDGTDKQGREVPAGVYRVRASGTMNQLTFTTESRKIEIR